jgi:hypothetical protein
VNDRIDLVYTWVDDQWPGFRELLESYAADRHDLNPNRYRDNLDLLKYSLRSVERYLPWIGQVLLLTCRPQVPPWLNRTRVRVVHHDEFMPADHLPTFNSFAIVSNLHRIEGLAPRLLCVNDDLLFGANIQPGDFFDAEGRARIYQKLPWTRPAADQHNLSLSPWNRALACSNALLDARFGPRRRRAVSHVPTPVTLADWRALVATWPDAFARTSASRFRSSGNVAPGYLYSHFLLDTGRATAVSLPVAYRWSAYHAVRNVPAVEAIALRRLAWQHPKFFCLNDDFGARPHPRVVALVRRWLDARLPAPSRYEHPQDR